ncbi:MAG: restriction endonuclease subunit S [Spirochaetaceae bacterium]|nr:restriction endonuclease subunit S [Spirochaetaceae bacterium]
MKGENGKMKSDMEQTEIEAPYELPEGWKWDFAKNLADIYTGNSINEKLKQEKYLNQTEGLNFIATKDIDFDGAINYENGVKINDYEKFKTAPKNTPLLCIEGGSAGRKLGFSEEEVCFGNKLCAFVCRDINPKLLYFYLQSNFFYHCFMKERHGLIGGVSVNTLKQIPFPLPPTLAEQQRIVNRIESMFAKLDEAKEHAQNVVDGFETRKAAILHKAFTGELTAKWRKENGVSDDSWEEKTIGEISSKITDGEHSTPKRVDQFCGYYLLSARNIHNGEIRLDDVDFVTENEYERIRKRCNPTKNDILISCSGSIGRVCVIQDNNKYVMVRSAAMVKLLQDNPFYIAYMLQSFNVQQQIEKTKKQSCQANLFLGAIKQLLLPVPTLPEQVEIVRILDIIIEKENKAKQASEAVLEQIDLLKKSILARAFRGEL